jgi:signal transduction histidine kinase
MPIRLRLTVAFAIAMAVVLVLAGSFVYIRVANDLQSSIDDTLRTRIDDVARQLQSTSPAVIGLGGPRAEGAEDVLSEVVAPDGKVVDSSEGQRPSPALDPSQLALAREQLTFFDAPAVPGIEGQARLVARPVETQAGTFVAITGASTGDRAETLSGLVKTFSLGGPLALLLASALGYGLATLAMRPVEAMRARAGRITLERSGERLPLPAADDEIGRLGETLNEMLTRIEASIERERSFVADAGHELRTPLAILRSELELGMRPDRSPEDARAAMRSAIEEADRLQRLADDLLALARSDASKLALEPRDVMVGDLLERTRRRFSGRAEAEGRTVTTRADGALRWPLDAARMEAALGNLVENALRHGAGTVHLSAAAEGEELMVSVSDKGPGLPPDFADQAFERFARAESGRTSSGAGLGLAIVRAVAEAHGGTVSIDGRGDGAVVVLRLPRVSPREPGA